ncbi:MAG: hypothetical protein NTZ50_02445 [Chloroflexi bacterium]|nr:hypothetical protein [Chloroflexota bacterium]
MPPSLVCRLHAPLCFVHDVGVVDVDLAREEREGTKEYLKDSFAPAPARVLL